MSLLQEKMPVALAELKVELGATAPTDEQITAKVHAVIDPQITDLQTNIRTILASEKDDAAKIADLTAVSNEFIDAFTPAPAIPAPATDAPPVTDTPPASDTTTGTDASTPAA